MEATKLTLTVNEAAQTLGISANLAYQLCKEGRLPSIRISERRIVVPRAALLRLLDHSGSSRDGGEAGGQR